MLAEDGGRHLPEEARILPSIERLSASLRERCDIRGCGGWFSAIKQKKVNEQLRIANEKVESSSKMKLEIVLWSFLNIYALLKIVLI